MFVCTVYVCMFVLLSNAWADFDVSNFNMTSIKFQYGDRGIIVKKKNMKVNEVCCLTGMRSGYFREWITSAGPLGDKVNMFLIPF